MSGTTLNRRSVARLGRMWKQVSQLEASCFHMASELGADTRELYDSSALFADKLHTLTDIEAGVLVLSHFGGEVPEELCDFRGASEDAPPPGAVLH